MTRIKHVAGTLLLVASLALLQACSSDGKKESRTEDAVENTGDAMSADANDAANKVDAKTGEMADDFKRERDDAVEKMKVQKDKLDAKIDELQAKADKQSDKAKAETERQKARLEEQRKELDDDMDKAKNATADAWQNVKSGFKQAGHEIDDAFDKAGNKINRAGDKIDGRN